MLHMRQQRRHGSTRMMRLAGSAKADGFGGVGSLAESAPAPQRKRAAWHHAARGGRG